MFECLGTLVLQFEDSIYLFICVRKCPVQELLRASMVTLLLDSLNFPPQIEVLNKNLFLTSKPMIYLVNLSEKDYIRKKNKW